MDTQSNDPGVVHDVLPCRGCTSGRMLDRKIDATINAPFSSFNHFQFEPVGNIPTICHAAPPNGKTLRLY